MKWETNLFLFIILCISFTSCANLEPSMTQAEDPFKVEQPATQKSSLMQQGNNILSKDYAVAEKALNKALLEKNKDTVRLGLKSSILSIRLKTVEAIRELNDKDFIPNLIDALQENRGLIDGGSETQVLQDTLNKTIISTLGRLTKLKFKVSEPLSSEDVQKVIDKSKDWCKSHKKDM